MLIFKVVNFTKKIVLNIMNYKTIVKSNIKIKFIYHIDILNNFNQNYAKSTMISVFF